MTRRPGWLTALTIGLLLTPALGAAQAAMPATEASNVSPPLASISEVLPAPQQGLLSGMHATNQFEMTLGSAAAERAGREAVRRYGDRLLRDHRLADRILTSLSRDQNIPLWPVDRLPDVVEHQVAMQKGEQLQRLRGAAFDEMYLAMMVEGHGKAIGTLEQRVTTLDDGELKQFISRMLPILRQHLELATRLQQGVSKVDLAGRGAGQ